MFRKLAVVSILAAVIFFGALAILPQGNIANAQFEVTSATVTGTTTILPGTEYDIVASGFNGSETVEILIDGTRFARGEATAGTYTGTVKVLSHFPQGSVTVSAQNSNETSVGSYSATINPALIVSKSSGPAGSTVSVGGYGLSATESYTIYFTDGVDTTQSNCMTTTASVSETVASGTTTGSGSLYKSVTVPSVSAGTYYFVGIGGTSAVCAED